MPQAPLAIAARVARQIAALMLLAPLLAATGCTVHYFDPETGTEHIWGVGHMAMKPGAPSEGLKAVARRTDVVGVSLGKLQEGMHLEVGWAARQRVDIMDADTRLCLAWPGGSFYNARIGSEFPPALDDCGKQERGRER